MSYSFTAGGSYHNESTGSPFSTGIAASVAGEVAGNILAFTVFLDSAVTLNSVSDSTGNTWTIVGPTSAGGGMTGWGIYCVSLGNAGTNYITLTVSATSTLGIYMLGGELQGGPATSVFAGWSSSNGTGTSAPVSTSSLTAGSAVIYSGINDVAQSCTASSGYSIVTSNSASIGWAGMYKLSSAAGVETPAMSWASSGGYAAIAMAFNPSSSGGVLKLAAANYSRRRI